MSRRKSVGIVSLVIVAVLAVVGAWWLSHVNPLPNLDQVEYVVARFYHPEKQREVKVAMKDTRLPQLWSCLQPATRLKELGNWPLWGDLQIVTRDNRVCTVALFNADGTNAYEINASDGVQLYFGGSKAALEELLLSEAGK